MSSNLDFTKICRTCLTAEDSLNLSIHDAFLSEMLMKCTNVKVAENDGLPQRICMACIKKLNRSYLFKELCEKSDQTLRNQICDDFVKNTVEDIACILPSIDDIIDTTLFPSDTELFTDLLNPSTENNPESESIPIENKPKIIQEQNYISLESLYNPDLDQEVTLESNQVFNPDVDQEITLESNQVFNPDVDQEITSESNHFAQYQTDNESQEDKENLSTYDSIRLKILAKSIKIYDCLFCKDFYYAGHDLNNHIKEAHSKENELNCSNSSICYICSKDFSNHELLDNHLNSHGKLRKQCGKCGFRFRLLSHLHEHIIQNHGAEPFQCPYCSNSYGTKQALRIHLRLHSGKMPFVCNVCGKKTITRMNLVTHMRLHTKDKPFICDVCGRQFAHQGSLSGHKKRHRAVKPHVCEYCRKRFVTYGDLKLHMVYHKTQKSYECTLCSKTFVLNKHLIIHLRTHSGERPYKCTVCLKAFKVARSLRLHLKKRHNINYEHRCQQCDASFSKLEHLHMHINCHNEQTEYRRVIARDK